MKVFHIRALTRYFGKITFLKLAENNLSRLSLSQHLMPISNVARSMVRCVWPGGLILLAGSWGKAPKVPATLRYLKPENS